MCLYNLVSINMPQSNFFVATLVSILANVGDFDTMDGHQKLPKSGAGTRIDQNQWFTP